MESMRFAQSLKGLFTLAVAVSLVGQSAAFAATTGTTQPTISQLTPKAAVAGSPDTPVTIVGTNFATSARVYVNGIRTVTFVSSSQLKITLPASLLAQPGADKVYVLNGDTTAKGAVSEPATFTVTPKATTTSAPTIKGISPRTVVAGSPDVKLMVVGTGFVDGAKVYAADTALATSFQNATTLGALVPAVIVAKAGEIKIGVVLPDGTKSGLIGLLVTPKPTTTSAPTVKGISPRTVVAGSPDVKLIVVGTGFVDGAKVYAGDTALATSFQNAATLGALVPAVLVAKAGEIKIGVVLPDGTKSGLIGLLVTPPATKTTTSEVQVYYVPGSATAPATDALYVRFTVLTTASIDLTKQVAVSVADRVSNPLGSIYDSGLIALLTPTPNMYVYHATDIDMSATSSAGKYVVLLNARNLDLSGDKLTDAVQVTLTIGDAKFKASATPVVVTKSTK